MRKLASFMAIMVVGVAAYAAPAPDRRSMATQYVGPAARNMVASKQQISAGATVDKSSIRAETPSAPVPKDKRDNERRACVGNNIGVGNTFVWASRYSNSGSYSSMVEDTENPENNICFVKVELKSADPKINVSDIPAVYYEMGRNITCGSWVNEDKIKQRILDAKKSGRTWGTVAGVVGGAAVGVGSMELFGNRWIGGAVEGQKHLERNDPNGLLRSQLLVLKDSKDPRFDDFKKNLLALKRECTENEIWKSNPDDLPPVCAKYDFDYLLAIYN